MESSSRILCKYFMNNFCTKGDSCKFSHDRNARPDMVCRYYLAGECSYGKKCRYDHVRPKYNGDEKGQNFASNISLASNPIIQRQATSSTAYNENPWNKQIVSTSITGNGLTDHEFHNPHSSSQNLSLESHFGRLSPKSTPLCPYFEQIGICVNGEQCRFVHGLMCDMCGKFALHPNNDELRRCHHRECLALHEKNMENAFAQARSLDKQCGICMETVFEKGLRFGILENCVHCFCFECIKKWRTRCEQFDVKTIRGCPECRIKSDFVIPSTIWVEDKRDKQNLIHVYKENTKKIQCKFIKSGDVDNCPFGNKCFYKHQINGKIIQGESPRTLRKKKRHQMLLEFVSFPSSEDDDDSTFSRLGFEELSDLNEIFSGIFLQLSPNV